MLEHFIIGPTSTGRYLVAYKASGVYLSIVTDDCATHALACDALQKRRAEQINKKHAIQLDHKLRGARF